MKKTRLHLLIATLPLCLAAFTAYSKDVKPAPSTFDPGVAIGGTVWATRNVGEPGMFADRPEDRGNLYNLYDSRVVCPEGWRPPKFGEVEKLVRSGSTWATVNGTAGRLFGEGGGSIFLPAAGYRSNDGNVYDVGRCGGYWTSAAYLFFTDTNVWPSGGYTIFDDEFSVRCVAR